MTNELMKVQPGVITFDYEDAKEILDTMLAPWKGLTTEGADGLDIKTAKASRAELNRMKNDLENGRKAIKREFSKPYDAFAGEVKNLVETIDFYVKILDTSIKIRENAAREDRKQRLKEDYIDFAPMIADIVPFERIFEDKWANSTYGTRKAQEEMFSKVERIRDEYETLREMKGTLKFYDEDKVVFFETLSLKEALANENHRSEMSGMIRDMERFQREMAGEDEEHGWYRLTICCTPETLDAIVRMDDVLVARMEEVDGIEE